MSSHRESFCCGPIICLVLLLQPSGSHQIAACLVFQSVRRFHLSLALMVFFSTARNKSQVDYLANKCSYFRGRKMNTGSGGQFRSQRMWVSDFNCPNIGLFWARHVAGKSSCPCERYLCRGQKLGRRAYIGPNEGRQNFGKVALLSNLIDRQNLK